MNNIQTEYAEFVASRAKVLPRKIDDVLHAGLGIGTEAGEIQSTVKKAWVYEQTLNEENIHEELGDLMFYVQHMCNVLGWTLEEVMRANIDKLTKRYPTGYSDKHAALRLDKVSEETT